MHNKNDLMEMDIEQVRSIAAGLGIKGLKKMEKEGEITEDDLKKSQDEVQKITDKFIKDVDTLLKAKEQDIMAV